MCIIGYTMIISLRAGEFMFRGTIEKVDNILAEKSERRGDREYAVNLDIRLRESVKDNINSLNSKKDVIIRLLVGLEDLDDADYLREKINNTLEKSNKVSKKLKRLDNSKHTKIRFKDMYNMYDTIMESINTQETLQIYINELRRYTSNK